MGIPEPLQIEMSDGGMSLAEWIIAIVGPAGLAALIPRAMKEYREIRNGNARREKDENRKSLGRLVIAEEYVRVLERHISKLERMLILMGVPENKLPTWPQREKV